MCDLKWPELSSFDPTSVMPPFKSNSTPKRSESIRTNGTNKEFRNRHELVLQAMSSAKEAYDAEFERNQENPPPTKTEPSATNGAKPAGAVVSQEPANISSTPSSAPLMPGKPNTKPPLAPINTDVKRARVGPDAIVPERKGTDDIEAANTVQFSPATAAYRDLLTGDVVEIDQEGNAATPTQHPTIKAPVSVCRQAPLPEEELDSLPSGLNAAANFLSDRNRIFPDERDGDEDDDEEVSWSNDVSAHVSGFAVASSKRNADFHALFRQVPEDDYLIKSYGCALSRDLLLHGRMYISEAHLGFHSNIFGWVTEILVPFSEIVSIEKRNTAFVIPNAIMVATLQHKYLFNSLVSRDLTYSMLVNIWRLSRPQPLTPEIRSELSQVNAEEPESSDPSKAKLDQLRSSLTHARNVIRKQNEANSSRSDSSHNTEEDDYNDEKENDDPAAGHIPTECACGRNNQHYSSVLFDHTYDVPMKTLFGLFYKTDFMEKFWRDNQNLKEVHISDWAEGKSETPGALASREVTYIKPLNGSVGPKQTRCNITEEELHLDFNDYCTTLMTTRTPDVPNGNTFSIKTRTCFMWGKNSNTRIVVTCATEWKGRSMLRSIIDKASIDGQRQYYADLNKELSRQTSRIGGGTENEQNAAEENAEEENKEDAKETAEEQRQETKEAWSPSSIVKSILEIRPSVLFLGSLIFVLILSHVWMYVAGPSSYTRDPGDPHRLTRRNAAQSASNGQSTQKTTPVMVENELQVAMQALERSRRITARLESDVEELQALLSGFNS